MRCLRARVLTVSPTRLSTTLQRKPATVIHPSHSRRAPAKRSEIRGHSSAAGSERYIVG